MLITVLHTGQSGVERGADRAARLTGISVAGVCSAEGRDELGMLPAEILRDLARCETTGVRNALRATLAQADALVIAVPEARRIIEVTGMDQIRRASRNAGTPVWVVDPTTDLDAVSGQMARLLSREPLRVMITGPRLTRWREGERLGGRIVAELSMHVPEAVRRHRVLVVDDHAEVVETARDLVQALGHVCVTATNGAQALEVATTFKPDVALLDLRLPDATGYDLARKLRERQGEPLFLAAITGWDHGKDPAAALAAGFDRHVVKPATATVIQQLLSEATASLAAG